MDAASRQHIRYLWEETPMPASRIAALYGITKNKVIGMAQVGLWQSFNEGSSQLPPQETMLDRLDALDRMMDDVLKNG